MSIALSASSPQQQQHIPKIFTLAEIQQAIRGSNNASNSSFEVNLMNAIQQGFVDLEDGKFFAAPIQTMGLSPFPFVGSRSNSEENENNNNNNKAYAAQTCVKSGYFVDNPYYVIKVATGGHPLPSNWGCMQVYSQQTGRLQAILLDDGILTEIRTASVGCLAARLLAPSKITKIGMVGTGVQARYQMEYLQKEGTVIGDCRTVMIWGRTRSKVEDLFGEYTEKGWTVEVANDCNELLLQCELIITTTSSRTPLLGCDEVMVDPQGDEEEDNDVMNDSTASFAASFWSQFEEKVQRTGLHITCVGSDAPGKVELAPNFVTKYGSLLVADTVQQSRERGEFQHVLQNESVAVEQVMSLGQLISQSHLHRQRTMTGISVDARVTIFDTSGVALQDCIVSEMTYKALLKT
jgi:ornithine cyclodeaminase